jgi:hypothetical protein
MGTTLLQASVVADVSYIWTLDVVLDESLALRQPAKIYKQVPIGAIVR